MILTVTANASIDKRYVVENFGVGEVNRVKSCVYTAGGKGLNVSRVAYLCAEPVTATGFLGGHAGAFIDENIKKDGIINDFVWCEGESRTCINIWDETNKNQTEFLEPGFEVTEADQNRMLEKFKTLLENSDIVTISGSTPKGAGAELYKQMIAAAKEKDKKVLLDTSGKLLVDCLAAKPTIIKPNIDEIFQLTGKKPETMRDAALAAKEIHEAGIEYAVISMGKNGAVLACSKGVFHGGVPAIQTVNTVGCGDAMTAGFAVSLINHFPIEEALRFACAVSAASALSMETGFFTKAALDMILPQIKITKLM